MGKIKMGKSMHTLTTTKYNSSNMTNTKIINAVNNGSMLAYEILNLKYDIKKLKDNIRVKIQTVDQLNKQVNLFCKRFGCYPSEEFDIKIKFKPHRAQFVIEQHLFMAWCLWLNDEDEITREMINKTAQYLQGFTEREAKALLVKQINDWVSQD